MRKMKRLMAFALSAVVMLTTVNMPMATARAQSEDVASIADAEKKVEKVEIQLNKDTFAPNDLRDIAANVKFNVSYDDGTGGLLSSLKTNSNDVQDEFQNTFRIKIDDGDFWYSNMKGPGEHTISVTGSDGTVYGQTKFNFGKIDAYEYDKLDATGTEIDSYKYYEFTVEHISKVNWSVEGVENPDNVVRVYKNEEYATGSYISMDRGASLFYPGHTYYMMASLGKNSTGDGFVDKYKVSLDIDVQKLTAQKEGIHIVPSEAGETYCFSFYPPSMGSYEFWLLDSNKKEIIGDFDYYYSNVTDMDGNHVSGWSWTSSQSVVNLKANVPYVVSFADLNPDKTYYVRITKLMEPDSVVITPSKTDFVVGMEANYFKDAHIEFTDIYGEKTIFDDLTGYSLDEDAYRDIYIYYSVNGSDRKSLDSTKPMDTVGVMTISLMYNNNVIGSFDLNIKPFDQVDIPEVKSGGNPNMPLYRLYKFISPVEGTVDITSDAENVYFDIYKFENESLVELEADSKLEAGETYYCKDVHRQGRKPYEANVNLTFDGKVKLMGVKITGFDKTLYDLDTAMLTDDRLDKMKSAIRYKLVYSDGSEVDDSNVPADVDVSVKLEKDEKSGLIAKVSCGDLSDELKIAFKAPSDAPVVTFSGNKVRLGITGEGQHVYQFKAPVTGYYGLEMRMTGGYYGCYSSFYSSSELVDQPDVDMNQRLVKAGETYYVCIFAPGRLTNVKLVCTPRLTCATTTADGSIAVSKQVGTGEDAYYQIEEEKIARIKSVTLAATSYTYDAKAKEPAVTVKNSDGEVIAEANYTVTYINNTNVGKATAKITFKGNYAGTVNKTFAIKKFAAPATPRITKLENTERGITVTWTVSENATSYEIYRSVNGGKFVKADTLYIKGANKQQTLGYVDFKAKTNGGKYVYKIIAVRTLGNVTVKSAASAGVTSYYMAIPSGIKMANSAKRTVRVVYAANARATGYQIRYSLKSNMSGAKVIKMAGSKSAAKNITGLTKGKKYYVSVRSYKTVGKKTYYSVWSTPKSVAVNK